MVALKFELFKVQMNDIIKILRLNLILNLEWTLLQQGVPYYCTAN